MSALHPERPYAGWHSFRWATSPDDPDPRVLVGTDPHGREWSIGEVVPRAWRDSWFVELADPRRGGRRYLGCEVSPERHAQAVARLREAAP